MKVARALSLLLAATLPAACGQTAGPASAGIAGVAPAVRRVPAGAEKKWVFGEIFGQNDYVTSAIHTHGPGEDCHGQILWASAYALFFTDGNDIDPNGKNILTIFGRVSLDCPSGSPPIGEWTEAYDLNLGGIENGKHHSKEVNVSGPPDGYPVTQGSAALTGPLCDAKIATNDYEAAIPGTQDNLKIWPAVIKGVKDGNRNCNQAR